MTQRRTLNALPFFVSWLLALGLLLAIFLIAAPASAYSRDSSPGSSAAPGLAQSKPLLTAAASFTYYLPIIHRDVPFRFADTFNDPASGWPIHGLNLNEPYPPGPWSSGYGKEKISETQTKDQNVYNVKTAAAWNSWIYTAPVVLANTANFTVQLDGKIAQTFMWASSWGMYFNANANRSKFYTVQVFEDTDGQSAPTLEVRRWDAFQGDADDANEILVHRRCHWCDREDFKWTQLRVVRVGETVFIHAGGVMVNAIHAPEYMSSEYKGVGVYQGNFEWNDFHPRRYGEPAFQIDNFIAEPVFYR
ncbi:MAG TPA: hypothetical protein VJG32_02325 [Anaerolineae bacterium]|nr:hypothetical protein [Anaerolineae bacterium]